MKIIRGEIPEFINEEGVISFFEYHEKFKFCAKRLFWVTNVPPGGERGCHAHHKTVQLLICIRGRIKVKMHDGKESKSFFIKENDYVLIPEMVWDSQVFYSSSDILVVLASTKYDPKDYINEFEDFIMLCNKKK